MPTPTAVYSDTASRISSYDFLLLWIAATSMAIMVLMMSSAFSAGRSLALGSVFFLGITTYFHFRSPAQVLGCANQSCDYWLIGCLLIALFFRMNGSSHYMGGQDQGLYVTFSGILQNFGGPYFPDVFRNTLPEALRAIYDKPPQPGLYAVGDGLHYYVGFYPLHPGWMAVFSGVLGPDKHVLSVLLFSFLGVTGAYFLARELSAPGDIRAARLAALFMAVNPALGFLAQYPLSETQSLAVTLNAAYLLAKSLKAQGNPQILLMGTSLALLACQVFTRLSFPVFIVPAIAFYVLSYSSRIPPETGKRLRIFLCMLGLVILIILITYRLLMPSLADLIFSLYARLLREHRLLVLAVALISLLGILALQTDAVLRRLKKSIECVIPMVDRIVLWLPLLIFLASFPTIIETTQSGVLFNDMKVIPEAAGFHYHMVYRWVQVITPQLWLTVIALPLLVKSKPSLTIPLLFICATWVLTQSYVPTLPYLYYHARYLCSELAPFSLVVVSIILVEMWQQPDWRRYLAPAIVVSALLVMIPFSTVQLRGVEGEDPQFFRDLNAAITDNDVLIAYQQDVDSRITVPIRYYFNKRLFVIPNGINGAQAQSLVASLLERSPAQYGRIMLLTSSPATTHPFLLTLERNLPFRIRGISNTEHHRFDSGHQSKGWARMLLPFRWKTTEKIYALYSVHGLTESQVQFGCPIDFSIKGNSSHFTESGWSAEEETGRWTDGSKASIYLPLKPATTSSSRDALLRIRAMSFSTKGLPQRVSIMMHSRKIAELTIDSVAPRNYDIPIIKSDLRELAGIRVEFEFPDAHSPHSVKLNTDPRKLGIFVSSMTLLYAGHDSLNECKSK